MARTHTLAAAGAVLLSPLALAQIPDSVTSLDPGGRQMGLGGVGYLTGADTFSSYFNPAGLGYISRTRVAAAFRNLPQSRSLASGDFNDQTLLSTGETGARGLSHVGFALPSGRGTLGIALTLGGFMDDTRAGSGLVSGGLTVNNYLERIKVRTDFVSVGYGQASGDQTFSWGASALLALTGVTNRQTGDLVDGNGNTVGTLDVDNDETGTGVGFVAGVQFSPRNRPNMSLGFSFRSEINLSGNDNTASVYDKIPARLAGGIVMRKDGLRGGRDFLVYGAEVQHFLAGGNSSLVDRKAQTTAGFGFEYNYIGGFGSLPIRVGFQAVPSGGNGFGSRNAFTFGIGYRPGGSDLSIDVNFGRPEGGGSDMSLSVGYRFK